MENKNPIAIVHTTIATKKTITSFDGHTFALMTIPSKGCAFEMGQFAMIRTTHLAANWAYPYMVLYQEGDQFAVLAREDSALYPLNAGDAVVFWGPCGNSDPVGINTYALITEPATYFLLLPLLLQRKAQCKGVVLVGRGNYRPILDENAGVVWADAAYAANEADKFGADKCIAALNYPTLVSVSEQLSDTAKANLKVFAATRMGCGIGACKGCNLHHADIPLGISVCNSGPFLPLADMDLETDKKCFIAF